MDDEWIASLVRSLQVSGAPDDTRPALYTKSPRGRASARRFVVLRRNRSVQAGVETVGARSRADGGFGHGQEAGVRLFGGFGLRVWPAFKGAPPEAASAPEPPAGSGRWLLTVGWSCSLAGHHTSHMYYQQASKGVAIGLFPLTRALYAIRIVALVWCGGGWTGTAGGEKECGASARCG